MNYLNGNLSYLNVSLDEITCFYSDGTVKQNGAYSGLSTIKETIYNVARINDKGMPLMVYLPKDNTDTSVGYLFMNINLDYILYDFNGYQVNSYLCSYDETLSTSQTINPINDYASTYTAGDEGNESAYCFEEYNYGYYQTGFTNDNNQSVFDLSNTRNYFADIESSDLTGKVWNAYDSRPDNSLYYNYCLKFTGYQLTSNGLNIRSASNTRGSIIYNSWQTAFDQGYGNGYVNGHVDGYNEGVGQSLTGEAATAFDYIGGAFGAVTSIMELQVLPHITLGLVFSIPLVLIVIMTIFKLVKK